VTILASVVALVQVIAAFAYFTVAALAWARRDGASWWAFRLAISFQCIRSAADCVIVLRHADYVPNEQAVWAHLFGALGGAICFWWLAHKMSQSVQATVSTWGRSQWEAMFGASMSPQIAADNRGRIVAANDAVTMLLQWEPSELIGQRIAVLVPKEYRAAHERAFQAARQSKQRSLRRTIRATAMRKDGSEFPVEISLSSWREEGKQFFIAAIRDLEIAAAKEGLS
jgi:PAS domain S-box-containing protein